MNKSERLDMLQTERAERVPWQVIAGNSYGHYRQHTPGIRDWMARYAE